MVQKFLPKSLADRFSALRHNGVCRPILDTGPIIPAEDGLIIFSMIGTKVLLPYLVAVKSLWHQLRRGRIMILDDGSLTDADKAILNHHCATPEIISINGIDCGKFPVGGTWERLLTILDRRSDDYIIQLDSDTVTIGALDEVQAAIRANRSFTLLGGPECEVGLLSCHDFTQKFCPDGPKGEHIQYVMEANMATLPHAQSWCYIRGCSGFTGFAKRDSDRHLAAEFASAMEALLDRKAMHIWGTEQVTSSFLIANEQDPLLLPYARHMNYWGEPWQDDMRFLHFVGAHRYTRSAYRDTTRSVLDNLPSKL